MGALCARSRIYPRVIDYLALALAHALLAIAVLRLAGNDRLDREEDDTPEAEPIRKRRGRRA